MINGEEYGIERVVLSGDSAGGNLAMGVAMRLIQDKDVLPDGILAVYPALRVDLEDFSPSFLYSFDDGLLSLPILKKIIELYAPNPEDRKSPFVSPIFAPDELIKELPKVEMLVGERDPLHDDCPRLALRLL